MLDCTEAVRRHICGFFAGHACEEHEWALGPAAGEMPWLRVAEFGPGPQSDLRNYVTLGACDARKETRLEFLISALHSDLRHVELLFMTAWYHRHEHLNWGHTLPLGEAWLPGSKCDHFLVSLPYPFGPKLEECEVSGMRVRVLWLLPITAAEREFNAQHGLDALEQKFEDAGLDYWSESRDSVV
jgi:hypothetical protein